MEGKQEMDRRKNEEEGTGVGSKEREEHFQWMDRNYDNSKKNKK